MKGMLYMKRNGIRILTLALCMVMLSGINAFAVASSEAEIATLLGRLSIINGYPDGELRLEQPVTRAEFSKISISASPYKNQVASALAVSPFSDVTYKHWAAPYVKLAVSNGLVTGYPDSTFRPSQTVLLEEAATIFLRLLGYTDDDFGYSWPYGQVGLAQNIGLLDNVTAATGTALSRRDVMLLTYNLLTCSPKGSTTDYLESIQYKLVEDMIVIATNTEDSSVNPGRVATSSGTYKIDDSFNHSHVGMRGDAVLKNGDTLVCFIPYNQSAENHVVYSKLDNVVVTYKNGSMSQLDLSDSTTAYAGTKATTFGAAKADLEMGDLISVKRDDSGNVEYVTISSGNMTGPVTVRNAAWLQELSVGDDITVMRDGVRCNADDIKTYDIVYYSPDLNMVLAYSKKVTGIYESASPNKDQLTQVTISGATYKVESVEAFNALSSSGKFNYGDTVTVLLGKDGDIAGVAAPSATESSVVGYFQSAGVKNYKNQAGDTYSNFYITVIGTDGNAYEYAAKRDYSDSTVLNQVARITFDDGVATVGMQKAMTLSGTVDVAAKTIGSYRFADSVNILDIVPDDGSGKGAYATVFLQRLDQIYLNSSNVIYYGLNDDGEIDELILNDATGECYQYGIMTKAEHSTGNMNISGSYTYDIAGQVGSTSTNGSAYNVGTGQAVMILSSGGRVQTIKALSKLSGMVSQVTGGELITQNGTRYQLSDKVVIYKKTSYDYTVLPISALDTDIYRMSAYYDRSMERGGRIRVIIAEER